MAGRNDNSLGAPASGFGQEISYTSQPNARGVPQMRPQQQAGVNAGVKGGQSARINTNVPLPAPPKADPTTELLMRMGEKVLAPHLAEMQRKKYLEGMTRAASGEAVRDIVNEQPWYAAAFGETDVVAGARAYTSQTAVSKVVSDLEDSMPEMRKMTPAAATAEYNRKLTAGLTGDSEVDMHVMGAVSKMLPAVMKRHAKEHYGYLQEEAGKAESGARLADADAIMSAATGLQSGTVTQEEFETRVAQLPQRGRPAEGRNLESYAKQLSSDLELMARKGQLHAINAYRKAGFMEALPSDLAKRVEGAVDVAENQLASRYSFEWADDVAAIKLRAEQPNLPGNTPNSVLASIATLNDKYRKATGSTRDIVPIGEAVSTTVGLGRAIYQAYKDQAKEEGKRIADLRKAGLEDQAKELEASAIDAYLAKGDLVNAKLLPGVSDEKLHRAFVDRYQRESKEGKGAEFLRLSFQQSRYVNPVVQAQMTAGLRGNMAGGLTEGMMQSYQQWRGLRQLDADGSIASAYFGQDNMDARMEAFHVLSNGGDPVASAGAYQYAFASPLNHKADPMSQKERKELSKGLMKELSSMRPEFLGGEVDLRDDQLDTVTRFTQRAAEAYMGAIPGITPERARKLALDQAQRDGLQIKGGFVWRDGKNQTPVTTEVERRIGLEMPADPASQGKVYRHALREGLGKYADMPVTLMRDPHGSPQMLAMVVEDGITKPITISFDAMAASARKWIEEDRKPRVPIVGIKKESLQFGPKLNQYEPAPGTKGFYSR